MTEERSLFENIKVMVFLMVMTGVYLLRYFTHETNITKIEEYYPVAIRATAVFYLLMFALFVLVLKKGGKYAHVWCAIFCGMSAATFLHRNTLGGVYLYLAMIMVLMIMVCVWGRLFLLLIPLYALGVFIYPGFFLLGAPMLLGAVGYQSKLRPIRRLVIVAGIITAGAVFYMSIHSEVPLWEDTYGVLSRFNPYMEFHGMDDEEMIHSAKILELIVFTVMISPYIYMYLRILHEVKWQAKYLSFLIAGVLPLAEYISQEHPGQVVWFLMIYYLCAVMFPVIWGDAVWTSALENMVTRIKQIPGWIIFIIWPFCLFPFRRGMICLASRWVTKLIIFRHFGIEV
ncbi:MAG: hypothetical protein K6B14_09065 [Lachnospiraceae bacterium]|nr:hypothetical protein [Lachnospiraceae bacterium]